MIVRPSKLLIFSFVLLLGAALFLLTGHWRLPDTGFQEGDFLIKQARHPLVVHGFQFAGYHQGRKNISIKAVRYSIEKMKLGLFSSGSLRVAKFKGAEIDIFANQVESGKKFQDGRQESNYSLKRTFKKEAMPASDSKNVVSFLFEPVKINFYNGKALITQIQADRASIKSKGRRVVFQGQISATSGTRSLTTDKLTLFPDSGLFTTDRPFELQSAEKQITGNNLTVDLYLKPVSILKKPN